MHCSSFPENDELSCLVSFHLNPSGAPGQLLLSHEWDAMHSGPTATRTHQAAGAWVSDCPKRTPATMMLGWLCKKRRLTTNASRICTKSESRAHTDVWTPAFTAAFFSSRKDGAAQAAVRRSTDKPNAVPACGGVLFSLKKEGHPDTCRREDELGRRSVRWNWAPRTPDDNAGPHALAAPGVGGKSEGGGWAGGGAWLVGGELFPVHRISVLQDEGSSGDRLHDNVNVFNTTELYT